tara:strand:- start:280 stop:414 length:135 start_codon:yes stop_codon:yes gene_type:complete
MNLIFSQSSYELRITFCLFFVMIEAPFLTSHASFLLVLKNKYDK